MAEKKTRTVNRNSPLGPATAAERVIELRAGLQKALLDAQADIIDRFKEREAAILARVPDDRKPAALRMIEAMAEPDDAVQPYVEDSNDAQSPTEALVEISPNLLKQPEPLRAGERRVGKARQ